MNSKGFEINKDTGSVDTYSIYASKNFHLNEGYKEDADYYFVLDVKDNNGNDASAHVSRIVKGYDEDEQTDIWLWTKHRQFMAINPKAKIRMICISPFTSIMAQAQK